MATTAATVRAALQGIGPAKGVTSVSGCFLMVFPHTEVVASRRGEGLAAQLVRFALDDQRAAGHRVDAQCWYVAEFLAEHPEYDDLRVSA